MSDIAGPEVAGGFDAPVAPLADGGTSQGNFALPAFSKVLRSAVSGPIELLKDVELNVKIELGRTKMLIEDVLKLADGSVVELDKLAGDPVDVYVNDQMVARGEVLVLNDNFCVRINEIVTTTEE
jgi:flagellar motor switch protein FliN